MFEQVPTNELRYLTLKTKVTNHSDFVDFARVSLSTGEILSSTSGNPKLIRKLVEQLADTTHVGIAT